MQMTKDAFENKIISMWDSVREDYKGVDNCDGVSCKDCPLFQYCSFDDIEVALWDIWDFVEFVEEW